MVCGAVGSGGVSIVHWRPVYVKSCEMRQTYSVWMLRLDGISGAILILIYFGVVSTNNDEFDNRSQPSSSSRPSTTKILLLFSNSKTDKKCILLRG